MPAHHGAEVRSGRGSWISSCRYARERGPFEIKEHEGEGETLLAERETSP